MLIAMTILLLTGGGGAGFWLFPQDFENRIEVALIEEEKQTVVLEQFELLHESMQQYNNRIEEIAESTRLLNQDHDMDKAAFGDTIEQLLQERKKIQSEILDARRKMISNFTKDQWELMFVTHKDAN